MRSRTGSAALLVAVALTVAVAVAATGCSGAANRIVGNTSTCAPFAAYRGNAGTRVTIYSPIRAVEADQLQKSWEQFQECTGIAIAYEGSSAFEAELRDRVTRGDAPDIALFPQPGLLADLARAGAVLPAADQVRANVDRWWSADWRAYGTVDGRLYAAPLTASVKSMVWYSPKLFAEQGYQLPTSWDDLLALSRQMVADGVTPWCAGIESGSATGWPVTDWLEDVVLRRSGAAVYDDWVAHRIPFDDPRIVAALDQVGEILRDPTMVNGGLGGVASIATTPYALAGLPVLEHKCGMHRQATFYAVNLPAGATVSPEGDVFAFYLPQIDPAYGHPVLGAGEFVGVFRRAPEVDAVARYLSTPDWVNGMARIRPTISANRGFDLNATATSLEQASTRLLTTPTATSRFDGSDLMPAALGPGTFWTGMTDWINGADTATVLHRIEASWPR